MVKYRMYVDETGNSDMNFAGDQNRRFLALTGVIVDLDHVRDRIHPELEMLKADYFDSHPDEPVILHRSEMMNRRGSFRALRDQGIRDMFDSDLLQRLREWDYRVITVCLDKRERFQKCGSWNRDPYHYCMQMLLERFCCLIMSLGVTGDVMAEARGRSEDRRLKAEFRNLWENGAGCVRSTQLQDSLTSRDLKVKRKSANVSGLQLADLIANPSRSEILAEMGLLGRELGPFAERIIEILKHKYYWRGTQMYGKSFL